MSELQTVETLMKELATVASDVQVVHQVSSDLGHLFHGEAHQDGHLAAQADGKTHLSVLQQLRDLLLGAQPTVPPVEPAVEPVVVPVVEPAAEQPL